MQNNIKENSLPSCLLNFRYSDNQSLSLTLSPMGREYKKEFPSLEGRGSKGVGESKPSPHPSPIGEGVFRT